jgi:hypothetical protein
MEGAVRTWAWWSPVQLWRAPSERGHGGPLSWQVRDLTFPYPTIRGQLLLGGRGSHLGASYAWAPIRRSVARATPTKAGLPTIRTVPYVLPRTSHSQPTFRHCVALLERYFAHRRRIYSSGCPWGDNNALHIFLKRKCGERNSYSWRNKAHSLISCASTTSHPDKTMPSEEHHGGS